MIKTLAILTAVTALCGLAFADDAPPLIPDDLVIETVAEGFKFTEGPALAPDGSIYFTDIPNNRIHRYDPATAQTTVFRENTGGANGLMFMGDTLIACEGNNRRLAVYAANREEPTRVMDRWNDHKLNSPNDVAIDRHGGIYFTDPRYGNRDSMEMETEAVYFLGADGFLCQAHETEQGPMRVYLVTPGQQLQLIDDLVRPNGIALSHDQRTLYVNDHGAKKIMAYPVLAPGKIGEGRVLYDTAELGGPDGMCVDHVGRLFVAIYDKGILVLSPAGERLGFIDTGRQTTNCTFGDDGRTLYVTADGSLKRLRLNTGAAPR